MTALVLILALGQYYPGYVITPEEHDAACYQATSIDCACSRCICNADGCVAGCGIAAKTAHIINAGLYSQPGLDDEINGV